MIEHSRGQVITLNEITYDRDALAKFVSQFGNECINGSPKEGANNEPTVGYNVIDPWLGPDSKAVYEYPIIQNLLDKFTINIPQKNIQISYYPPGFLLPAHTDGEWNAHIMFPIMPEDGGAELIFHDVPISKHTRGGDYSKSADKIDYTIKYSTQHPTMFNTQIPHSAEIVTGDPRIYLKFMIPETGAAKTGGAGDTTEKDFHTDGHTWNELKQMAKDGTLFKDND